MEQPQHEIEPAPKPRPRKPARSFRPPAGIRLDALVGTEEALRIGEMCFGKTGDADPHYVEILDQMTVDPYCDQYGPKYI